MMTKPDDQTWYDYLHRDEHTNDERGEVRDEFRRVMANEAREILEKTELDESRYEVEVTTRTYVGAGGEWLMKKKEDVEQLRDVLDDEIGDESVGVFATPRTAEGEIAKIPEPDHVPVDEYRVIVELNQKQKNVDQGLQAAKSKTNDAVSE